MISFWYYAEAFSSHDLLKFGRKVRAEAAYSLIALFKPLLVPQLIIITYIYST